MASHLQSFFSASVISIHKDALLVYSLFKRAATSSLRRISVATRGPVNVIQAVLILGVNTESLSIQYSTAPQRISWNGCDVSRLVVTEHERSKYSLLDCFYAVVSHAAKLAQVSSCTILTSTYSS